MTAKQITFLGGGLQVALDFDVDSGRISSMGKYHSRLAVRSAM